MKTVSIGRLTLRAVVAASILVLCTSFGQTQDPTLKPTYGEVKLEAGFEKDPFVVKVDAGGDLKTDKGGVTAYIAKEPDFRLIYKAGKFPLTFYVECEKDSTLLINMPDGKTWIANDDGPNTGLNPLIKITDPPSGQYDIWVGTFDKIGTPPAKLFITELK